MLTSFNPLVDYGYEAAPAPAAPPAAGPDVGATHSPIGPHIADLQGAPPIFGDHNIPLHVAFLGLAALAVVIALRVAGFRFSGVVGVGVGR